MNFSVILNILFGVFKRSVMVDSHDKIINRLEKTDIPSIVTSIKDIETNVEKLVNYNDKVERDKALFAFIEVDNAIAVHKEILFDFYAGIGKDIASLDYDESDENKAQGITDKYIYNFHKHAETTHFKKGTDPEIYRYVSRAMARPVEDIKKYHHKYLEIFNKYRGMERIEKMDRELLFFSRELFSTFEQEFMNILKTANKIN